MNKHWKDKWVKALRGGEYVQGRGCLKEQKEEEQVYTYCCLGVLCEIHIDVQSHIDEYGGDDSVYTYVYKKEDEVSTLMPTLKHELDISNKHEYCLIELNDNNDADFNQIADYIEKEM